jgi:hypothetical protein
VLAPAAVSVTAVPPGLQINPVEGLSVTAGAGLTVRVAVLVVVTAQLSVTVTVYVPLIAGITPVKTGFCVDDVYPPGPDQA